MRVNATSCVFMGVRCLAFAALLASSLPGQALPLDLLQSPVASVRTQAFYKILNLANANNNDPSLRPRSAGLAVYARSHPEVIPALVSLLELENIRVQSPPDVPDGEEHSDYYADLIGCVAALRDTRAAKGLLGAIATGDMATQGLAALGDIVVPGVISASRAHDVVTRNGAVITMREMVHRVNGARLSNSATAAVREALFPALRDENPAVRLSALDAIVVFHDDSVRAAVDQLSRSDPFTRTSAGRSTYPIREKAASYLATMPSRGAPPH